MVWMPLAYRAFSLAMASATRASSSHQVAAVVLHVLGREHEDVLVHEGLAQAAQVDRASYALDAVTGASLLVLLAK